MTALAVKEPPGVLARILARTVADLQARQAETPLAELERRAAALATTPAGRPRDFRAALTCDVDLALIAEFKPRSPSRGELRPDASPEEIARMYAPYARAMSVLCDAPHFGGGLDLLARARAVTPLPVLCKDFIVSRYQLIEARAVGADAVLLMASLLPPATLATLLGVAGELGMAALVEVHTARELQEVLSTDAPIIGVNSRDFHDLSIDLDRLVDLLAHVPPDRVRVAESGLETAADVDRVRCLADAALVGSTLMLAPDPTAKIRELGWEARP